MGEIGARILTQRQGIDVGLGAAAAIFGMALGAMTR
jgi:hypothetical protein